MNLSELTEKLQAKKIALEAKIAAAKQAANVAIELAEITKEFDKTVLQPLRNQLAELQGRSAEKRIAKRPINVTSKGFKICAILDAYKAEHGRWPIGREAAEAVAEAKIYATDASVAYYLVILKKESN